MKPTHRSLLKPNVSEIWGCCAIPIAIGTPTSHPAGFVNANRVIVQLENSSFQQ